MKLGTLINLTVALVGGAIAGYLAYEMDWLAKQADFKASVLQTSSTIQADYQKYDTLLHSLRAFVNGEAHSPTLADWRRFTGDLNLGSQYHGLYDLVFVQNAGGGQTFTSCPVIMEAPSILVSGLQGSDLCQYPTFRDALQRSTVSGASAVTADTDVVISGVQHALVGMYMPVFQPGSKDPLGWVGVHRDNDIAMAAVLPSDSSIGVFISNASSIDPSKPVYFSSGTNQSVAGLVSESDIQVGGDTLKVTFAKPTNLVQLPAIAFALVSIVLFLLGRVFQHGDTVKAEAQTLAHTMTRKFESLLNQFETIAANVQGGIFRCDHEWRVVYANDGLAKLVGIGDPRKLVGHGLPFADPKAPLRIRQMLQKKRGLRQAEATFHRPDGTNFTGLLSLTVVRNARSEVMYYDGVITDISLLKAQNQYIKELAYLDAVTKLPNRAQLYETMEGSVRKAEDGFYRMAVLFLDLDRFKLINDTLGHDVGDKLLVAVSERLKASARHNDLVCRLGGDEFVVLMHKITSDDDAIKVANAIVGSVGKPYELDGHDVNTTPSIGIAFYPEDGKDRESLLKCADAAMYAAKNAGKNCWRRWTPDLEAAVVGNLEMEGALRKALTDEQFRVEYEPQARINGRGFAGAEACLRWQHPRHGLQPASQFISVVAQTDLIISIGEWQLRALFKDMGRWAKDGVPAFPVCVPVATLQLTRGNLPDLLRELSTQYDVDLSRLIIEASYQALTDNSKEVISGILAVKAAGARIAFNEFTADTGGLGVLNNLPISRLVMSAKSLKGALADHGTAVMLAGALDIARKLGVETLARGVDNPALADYLKINHCALIQGPLYRGPCAASELAALAGQRPTLVEKGTG